MADFTHKRHITSVAQLAPVQVEQLRLCGQAYDGEDRPAERRLTPGTPDDEVLYCVELWDVVSDGSPLYEAWFYQVDSGSIFLAGTTEMVAQIIQSGLECEDPDRELELGTAMVRAGLIPPGDSEYQRFSRAADATQ
ncbi:hypothetical protein PV721_28000 [Streptomyces sp. MB09-01]|uniref:hypothetical protein n=1 Tax=Streptomyces sp. MB09-01 TaxID=3028666 RepID=UPI0029B08359|nr:hypothetical protein [Streptomyces sp. MB09-01]MDX3538127.1 hypothetical protein [Streptomyces sp. MB09-01]